MCVSVWHVTPKKTKYKRCMFFLWHVTAVTRWHVTAATRWHVTATTLSQVFWCFAILPSRLNKIEILFLHAMERAPLRTLLRVQLRPWWWIRLHHHRQRKWRRHCAHVLCVFHNDHWRTYLRSLKTPTTIPAAIEHLKNKQKMRTQRGLYPFFYSNE